MARWLGFDRTERWQRYRRDRNQSQRAGRSLVDQRDEAFHHQRTDAGKNEISAFIMMKDQVTPVRKIHTYGMRASETSELRFTNSKAEILGERGRGREQALTVLDRGRIGIAALAVGIAEAAFDRANSYANERKQFGHPIGNF